MKDGTKEQLRKSMDSGTWLSRFQTPALLYTIYMTFHKLLYFSGLSCPLLRGLIIAFTSSGYLRIN